MIESLLLERYKIRNRLAKRKIILLCRSTKSHDFSYIYGSLACAITLDEERVEQIDKLLNKLEPKGRVNNEKVNRIYIDDL